MRPLNAPLGIQKNTGTKAMKNNASTVIGSISAMMMIVF